MKFIISQLVSFVTVARISKFFKISYVSFGLFSMLASYPRDCCYTAIIFPRTKQRHYLTEVHPTPTTQIVIPARTGGTVAISPTILLRQSVRKRESEDRLPAQASRLIEHLAREINNRPLRSSGCRNFPPASGGIPRNRECAESLLRVENFDRQTLCWP